MELNSCIYTSKMGGYIANVFTRKSCPSGLNSCANIVESEGIHKCVYYTVVELIRCISCTHTAKNGGNINTFTTERCSWSMEVMEVQT